MEKETGLMRQVHRTVRIKGRKENNRGFDDWEGWGLGAAVCWRLQRGGERGGSGLNTDGGMWRVRYGGWRRIDGCGGGDLQRSGHLLFLLSCGEDCRLWEPGLFPLNLNRAIFVSVCLRRTKSEACSDVSQYCSQASALRLPCFCENTSKYSI